MTTHRHADQVNGWCETINLVCLAKLKEHIMWNIAQKAVLEGVMPSGCLRWSKRESVIAWSSVACACHPSVNDLTPIEIHPSLSPLVHSVGRIWDPSSRQPVSQWPDIRAAPVHKADSCPCSHGPNPCSMLAKPPRTHPSLGGWKGRNAHVLQSWLLLWALEDQHPERDDAEKGNRWHAECKSV